MGIVWRAAMGGLLLLLGGLLAAPPAEAQRAPRGSYLRTCPEVSMFANRLTAVCRDRDGQFRQTTLANVDRCVGDIANVDGRLRCNYGAPASMPRGSYQQSCTNVALNANTLVAMCRTMKGRQQRTSLANVDRCNGDIGNNNGQLTCTMR